MRPISAALVCVMLLVAGIAQAYDRHSDASCSDPVSTLASAGTTAPQDSPGTDGSAAQLHSAGCCFGSMVLAMPFAGGADAADAANSAFPPDAAIAPAWRSDNPERPPRS